MALNSVQAIKAYDSVRDTYSQNGIPTEEQAKAYIAMLAATAGVSGNLPSAADLRFFTCQCGSKRTCRKKIVHEMGAFPSHFKSLNSCESATRFWPEPHQ